MNKHKGMKGLTLVEILVALAIIGILFVAFSGVFVNGLTGIYKAGDRNEADYVAQKAIENRISGNTASFSNTSCTETAATLSISFGSNIIQESGIILDISYNDGEYNVSLVTFIPD